MPGAPSNKKGVLQDPFFIGSCILLKEHACSKEAKLRRPRLRGPAGEKELATLILESIMLLQCSAGSK
ncbi:MAG: hypothetical protein COA96_15285 [SAR86 cluster bacterium]|uniref:Uncharacterized protein n=1 Tax=SAR86 cluster bacterium TaxID=2030880 RepID=A0A2A5ARH3_9GAMM|nr:MAG: hypothetical protein COA96_15285 [SAR86 cluster bacterium]